MNFKTYYRGLEQPEREAFAKRANTSADYINIHLISRNKIPRKKLMESLADASNGCVSYAEVVDYFYSAEPESDAA